MNTRHNILCAECNELIIINNRDFIRFKNHFCSRSCRATYYNKRKAHVTINKLKEVLCKECGMSIQVNKHCGEASWFCVTHKKKKRNKIVNKLCMSCDILFVGSNRTRYCNLCLVEKRLAGSHKGGLKSVALQQRRSKNEIAFGELLAKQFSTILFNVPYFKDKKGTYWDADIILPDLKLAIHWNGPWHYKQISKKHSLKAIQNRDKIKHSTIEQNEFINYIIRDDGSYNQDKVLEEFNKFKLYLHMNFIYNLSCLQNIWRKFKI